MIGDKLKIKEKTIDENSMPNVMKDRKSIREQALSDIRAEQIVYGDWNNVDEVASEIWSGVHSSLLRGLPVFAYKSTKSGSELVQIVVVRNIECGNPDKIINSFGVGLVTTGYTSLYQEVPVTFLEKVVEDELREYKVEKDIQLSFNDIVNNFKIILNENNSNK